MAASNYDDNKIDHDFRVPSEPSRRKLWIDAIEQFQDFDYYVSKFYVCELHFENGSFRRIGEKTILSPNIVPTIFNSTEASNGEATNVAEIANEATSVTTEFVCEDPSR